MRLEADETKNLTARIFPFNAHPYLKGLMEAQRRRVDALEREQGRIIRWVSPRDDGRQLGQFHEQYECLPGSGRAR